MLLITTAPWVLWAQESRYEKHSYFDSDKKILKEKYYTKDAAGKIWDGLYVSYYANGKIESRGEFKNNATNGLWEFFSETGEIKMRGQYQNNVAAGDWEFYFDNGHKSMEGRLDKDSKEGQWIFYFKNGGVKETGNYAYNKRVGLWKSYFESGHLFSEIQFMGDSASVTEYHANGRKQANGKKYKGQRTGKWTFYDEKEQKESLGFFENDKKNGLWTKFYPTGKTAAQGAFQNDAPHGEWLYYYENGTVHSVGHFTEGKKSGTWKTYSLEGNLEEEIVYEQNAVGNCTSHYLSGRIKSKGQIQDEKYEGKWFFYYEDGSLEGECTYENNQGNYVGYYPNGKMKTRGKLDGNIKIGTWELYESNGKLSGYYKSVQEDNTSEKPTPINPSINNNNIKKNGDGFGGTPMAKKTRKGLHFFEPKYPEYKSLILSTNPFLTFLGILPFGVEFYNEDRLGHEFTVDILRNPFFEADTKIADNRIFHRGYRFSFRQKFYIPIRTGSIYVAHRLNHTNISYLCNNRQQPNSDMTTANANEQRWQYGIELGYRIMQHRQRDGITVDVFAGYSIGIRNFNVVPMYQNIFKELPQGKFSGSLIFGLNIGYSFSFAP